MKAEHNWRNPMCRFAVIMAIALCAANSLLAQTYSYVHGKRFAVTVTDEAVMKAPAWKADADKALARLLPDAKGQFGFEQLTLRPVGDKGWYWEVLYSSKAFTAGKAPTMRIAVLMDGSVVEPVVTKSKDL